MKFAFCKTLFLSLAFFALAATVQAEAPKRNSLLFLEIDDWVEVYVDGVMVFKKAASGGDLNEEVDFDLNPYVEGKDAPIVEIRLINAECYTCEAGNGWKIEFEVFQNDESVDYIIEEGDSIGGSVVFTIEYEWGYI